MTATGTPIAVVTGASSGIGAATARQLAAMRLPRGAHRPPQGPHRGAGRRDQRGGPPGDGVRTRRHRPRGRGRLRERLPHHRRPRQQRGRCARRRPRRHRRPGRLAPDVRDERHRHAQCHPGPAPRARRVRRRHGGRPLVDGGPRHVRGRRGLRRREERRPGHRRDPAPGDRGPPGPRDRDRARHGEDGGVRHDPIPRRRREGGEGLRGRGGAPDGRRRSGNDHLGGHPPPHVNIDLLVVRPRAQASNTKVHREL